MAGCYAPEADELQRRWLPREIFADIGIADTEPVVPVADAAAPPSPVTMEELAAQLADLLGAQKPAPSPSPPAPAPAPAPAAAAIFAAPCHRSPLCGLKGAVFTTYGEVNAVAAGAAAAAWPVTPYSPVPWQVPSNCSMLPPEPFVNVSSAPDYSMLPPPPPRRVPSSPVGTTPRSGTGVFLPRTDVYRHALPPARDVRAPNPRPWPVQQQQQQKEACAAAVRSQQRPNGVQHPQQRKEATAAAAGHACPVGSLALPKEWSYP